jgi:hypothetical protein
MFESNEHGEEWYGLNVSPTPGQSVVSNEIHVKLGKMRTFRIRQVATRGSSCRHKLLSSNLERLGKDDHSFSRFDSVPFIMSKPR